MSKVIVGVFALMCLAAPLFAADEAAKKEAPAAQSTEMKSTDGTKVAEECPKCHKPMAECKCHKGKHKHKKS